MKIYLIGSLRNEYIPKLAAHLRSETGVEVFDDWFAAGPEADDHWRDYEKDRAHGLQEALKGYAAQHVFQFDKSHLDSADAVVLAWPAGKSAHLEFGYCIGKGKPGWILLDGEPERFDVMLNFAQVNGGGVHTNKEDLTKAINEWKAVQLANAQRTDVIGMAIPYVPYVPMYYEPDGKGGYKRKAIPVNSWVSCTNG